MNKDTRMKYFNQLALSDAFNHEVHHLDKKNRIKHMYEQFNFIAKEIKLNADDISNNMGSLLTVMESFLLIKQPGLCPLLASHYNLCLGTILELGDLNNASIKNIVNELVEIQSHGLYLVTEIGCGNNAMSMKTEATFDKETQEFIINTPCPDACKFMPYLSLERQPKLAIVMARLILDQQDYGVHPFIVHCRDANGNLLPGISTSGMDVLDLLYPSVVDHAIISFDQVRIPHCHFLGGASQQVDLSGSYIGNKTDPRAVFFSSLRRVEWGKFVLTASLMSGVKISLAQAFHFARHRVLAAHTGRVMPLEENRFHRQELSSSYVKGLAAINLYESLKSQCLKMNSENLEFALYAGIVKSVSVELIREVVTCCMLRCGVQGKFLRNYISPALILSDLVGTAEGDSVPVMMKIAKDLLKYPSPSQISDNLVILVKMEDRLKLQISQRLSAEGCKMDLWNSITPQARLLTWITGCRLAAEATADRSDIQQAFINIVIMENSASFCSEELIDHHELSMIAKQTPCLLEEIYSKYSTGVAEEFDMTEIMRTSPLGSNDLAASWLQKANLLQRFSM